MFKAALAGRPLGFFRGRILTTFPFNFLEAIHTEDWVVNFNCIIKCKI